MPTRTIADCCCSARARVAGLTGICLLLFFWGLGSNRALTYHEVLMAATAKQMVLSGNWIVPWIGDHSWVEKPPLPQWLAAVCGMLGGFNEWTMRLPFAISAVIVVFLTVRLMTRLFDPRIGWLSGIIQATSVYMVMYARLAEADMLLLAVVMAAITVFHEVEATYLTLNLTQLHRRRVAFWLLLGLANLVKGIAFGSVLVVFTCGGWLLLQRDWHALRRWWSPLGIILAVGIAAAWPAAVAVIEPSALELWRRHLFGRAAGSLGYTQPVWYYLVQWPLQLLPWTPFFVMGARHSFSAAARQAGSDRFCWWWFWGQLGLLSCSAGKHHHYLIYALPALSPIAAQGVLACAAAVRNPQTSLRSLVVGIRVVAVGAVIGGIILGILRSPLRIDGWLLAPVLGMGLAIVAGQLARRDLWRAGLVLLCTVLFGHVYAQMVVMPRVDASAADKHFLAQVERQLGPDQPLAACGSQEMAQHLFYLKRPVKGIWNPADLPRALPESREIFVIARGHSQRELAALGAASPILQSTFSRREKSPLDRFTLFRVELSSPTAKQPALIRTAEVSEPVGRVTR